MCVIPAGPQPDTPRLVWQYAGFCAALVCSFVVFPTDLLASLVIYPHRKVVEPGPAVLDPQPRESPPGVPGSRCCFLGLGFGVEVLGSWKLAGALLPGAGCLLACQVVTESARWFICSCVCLP